MKSKYKNIQPALWVSPEMDGYKLACCDCGLVHVFSFRIKDKGVQFKLIRDNRATGQIRRRMTEEQALAQGEKDNDK